MQTFVSLTVRNKIEFSLNVV